ncbi:MAG TPA: sigma-70 family RNA polymerase sigma factor [Puia sp.]
MDDQTILELIRNRKNDLALNVLYRNFPAIRKLIRSHGGSTKDAEDVFQEALIILIRNDSVTGIGHGHDSAAGLHPDSGPGSEEAFDVHAVLESESRIRLAEQALNDLKERCRELLLLFYERQLSLKAIGAKMGYGTENSTKNQKYKCLEAARTRLKELQLYPRV